MLPLPNFLARSFEQAAPRRGLALCSIPRWLQVDIDVSCRGPDSMPLSSAKCRNSLPVHGTSLSEADRSRFRFEEQDWSFTAACRNKPVGLVVWNEQEHRAQFQFDRRFARGNLDVAPLMMPLSRARGGE